jgi:hypothetical protein
MVTDSTTGNSPVSEHMQTAVGVTLADVDVTLAAVDPAATAVGLQGRLSSELVAGSR